MGKEESPLGGRIVSGGTRNRHLSRERYSGGSEDEVNCFLITLKVNEKTIILTGTFLALSPCEYELVSNGSKNSRELMKRNFCATSERSMLNFFPVHKNEVDSLQNNSNSSENIPKKCLTLGSMRPLIGELSALTCVCVCLCLCVFVCMSAFFEKINK